MFGAKRQFIRPYWIQITVVAIGAQHQVDYLEFHHTSLPNNVWIPQLGSTVPAIPNISPSISAMGSRNKSATKSSRSMESTFATRRDQSRARSWRSAPGA